MASSKVSCWLSFLREQCGVKGAREKGKTVRQGAETQRQEHEKLVSSSAVAN